MNISIFEENDVYHYKKDNDKKIFFKFTLNVIFFLNNGVVESLIFDNDNNYLDFEIKSEKSYYILIFGNQFINQKIIDNLVKIFNLKTIKFINLDIFYICGLVKINDIFHIDFENIYENNFKFNHMIYEKNNVNIENFEDNDLNLLGRNIDNFNKDLDNLIVDIKKFTIDNLILKQELINNKYLALENLIFKTDNNYNIIQDKINLFLKNVESKSDKTKNDNEIYRNNFIKNQNTYVISILKILENLDESKKKKQKEIDELEMKLQNLKNDIEHNLIDNQNNKYNIKDLGVFVHIFNINVWDDIYKYLLTLSKSGYIFDLYVNISSSNIDDFEKDVYKNLKNKIRNINIYQNLYITTSDNRGMDIGGFFISYIKMLEMKLGYKNIIKIHTKTNNNWRFAMLYAILGNKSIIDNNFKKMKDENIGMIGNQVINLSNIINKNSYNYINTYLNRFNVNFYNKGGFIPGTIFMIKGSVLRQYFNIQNLKNSYNEFEKDYCGSKINNIEGKPHAFERFFGFMVDSCNMKTVSFDS